MAEVLNETYLYSRRIRVIEDLAGSFPKDVSTLMVWEAGTITMKILNNPRFREASLSCSDCYKTGDTLIMILLGVAPGSAMSDFLPKLKPKDAWILESYHSGLPGCATALLRFKDGFVMGHISKWNPRKCRGEIFKES